MSGYAEKPRESAKNAPRQPPAPPRTGEGSGTALEAMLRKRKQVESPDPPDGSDEQPSTP